MRDVKPLPAADCMELLEPDQTAIADEKSRLYAPLYVDESKGMDWRELNMAISKAMQNYCGGIKCRELLKEGLNLLECYRRDYVPLLKADNPHELMRIHEVLDILEVSEMILNACLFRESSSRTLCFERVLPGNGSSKRPLLYHHPSGKRPTRKRQSSVKVFWQMWRQNMKSIIRIT